MKLLFDQNLSFKLCALLADLFPDSKSVRELGLDKSDDLVIWQRAKDFGYTLDSQDSDFAQMAAHYGHPPKVIWLRCGNQPVAIVEALLRRHAEGIAEFDGNVAAACLEIYSD
jgi:predicted nuclease of predicted toxin-antitoxin system